MPTAEAEELAHLLGVYRAQFEGDGFSGAHCLTPNFAHVIGPGWALTRLRRETAFDFSTPMRSATWSAV
jgi:hypothetical protein